MKTVATTLLTLFLSLAAHAADSPYNGTWVLDVAASRNVPEQFTSGLKEWRIDVQQTPAELTVGVKITHADGDLSDKQTHRLDGTPTKIETTARTPAGTVKVPTTSTAKMGENGTIDLTLEGEMRMGENVMKRVRRDRFELSDDGKTLTVHRKDTMPNGELDFALVFRRG